MTLESKPPTATMDAPWAGPVSGQERYSSLDVIRGVAIFGILLMNIYGFGGGMGAALFRDYGETGLNWWLWVVMAIGFEGTQRTLFSLLFGAGVIILTQRAEGRGLGLGVADIYYRRNIWLIAFGMFNAYVLLWAGDILYYYGIAALFLFPLRNLSPRSLILVGLAALAIGVALNIGEARDVHGKYRAYVEAKAAGESPDDEQEAALEAWPKALEDYKFDPERFEERAEAFRGSYADIFAYNIPRLLNMHGNQTYRYMFLDAFSVMVIGMALMKLGVMTLRRSNRFYLLMTLAGLGVGLTINAWEVIHYVRGGYGFLADADTFWSYDLGRICAGLGYLGLLLLFVRSGALGWLQARLAAVGRMALTNYLMHSVIAALLFYGVGLGMYGHLDPYELYVVVLLICLFQLLISKPWLERFRFGPAEWLWRSLTYMAFQPMRRAARPALQT